MFGARENLIIQRRVKPENRNVISKIRIEQTKENIRGREKKNKTKDKKREKNIEIIMRAFDGSQFLFTQKKLSIDDKEDMIRL